MDGRGRRIAVTGLGVVAPCGLGKEAFWSGLLGPGLDGVGRSVEIQDWDSSPYYDSPKEARRADLSEQYAVAAMIYRLLTGRHTLDFRFERSTTPISHPGMTSMLGVCAFLPFTVKCPCLTS